MIHELYTNIAVHGSPGGEYRLIVFWDDDNLIHVDQVNDVSSKNLFLDKPRSGNGLLLHIKWIESIGGFVKSSSEKGAWQFHARFLSSCQKTRQSQCRLGGHLGYILAEYVLRAFADVKGPGLVMELGASIMMMDNSIAISFIFPPLRSASLS